MDNLEKTIKEKIKDGKITCKEAFEIAAGLGIKPAEVGKALDKLKIKIKQCQLGCF
ncbi:MAG: hypothetical protein MUC95_01145 [Spirochaetes bacterium]|nr:hypothetical protein [Spirochaetota bacterium]